MSEDTVTGNIEVVDEGSPVGKIVEEQSSIQSFHSTLPESLREEASLKDFKSVDDLAKSYVSAQKMIGSSIRIPTNEAGEETWEEFYSKLNDIPGIVRLPSGTGDYSQEAVAEIFSQLGAPSSPDGYSIELDPTIESFVKPQVDAFKEVAVQAHLTPDQAKVLADWQLGIAKEQVAQIQQDVAAGHQMLKDKWGASYEERAAGARAAINHFRNAYGDSFDRLANSPLGNHPAVIEMLSVVGSQLGEGKMISSSANPNRYGMSAEEAASKISDLRNNRQFMEAYSDPTHRDHQASVDKLTQLYKVKNGL